METFISPGMKVVSSQEAHSEAPQGQHHFIESFVYAEDNTFFYRVVLMVTTL